ncbi:MAG TPA: hypothetical protein VET23_15705 [Chitinophagaceae bacterium]|nr:hypothetical protein [Chitinophagaceae bacterium]
MKMLVLIFIFTPFISYPQRIVSNQTDSFTHQKRIVTDEINIRSGLGFNTGIDAISYNTVNNNIFIVLHGSGRQSSGTILKDDIALLITEKDTIVIKSAGTQISYGSRYSPYNYDHQYLISKEDLIKLSKNKLLTIKRYTSEGIFDMAVKEKFEARLMKLSDALLKEMSK